MPNPTTPINTETAQACAGQRPRFTAIFIGESTLLIHCAEIFLQAGHTIYGVVSSEPRITRWSEEKRIPWIAPNDDLAAFLNAKPFDYLFSIVNYALLPEEILRLPRKSAINYHDAPLPRYAGMHATSWALLQRKKMHGVTWHEMVVQVDAGRILKQRIFEIGEAENAFSLNAKCYEAGIQSFAELLDDLSAAKLAPVEPNRADRTYFGKYKRPAAACALSWKDTAEQIKALAAALDFGPYENPLGMPKIVTAEEPIIVTEIDVVDLPSGEAPGVVTGVDGDTIRVATSSGEVALRSFQTIDGRPLSIADLVARYGVQAGYRFEEMNPDQAARLTALNEALCRHESYWVRQLSRVQPIELPYAVHHAPSAGPPRYTHLCFEIPAEFTAFAAEREQAGEKGDTLIAAFAAYLARLSSLEQLCLGFSASALRQEIDGFEGFFASYVTLNMQIRQEGRIDKSLAALKDRIASVRRHKTYARDVVARYPELSGTRTQGGKPVYTVVAEQVECLRDYQPNSGSELTLVLSAEGTECRWVYDSTVFADEAITLMQQQFALFLRQIAADSSRPLYALSLLSDEERHRLIVEWNTTEEVSAPQRCIHAMFEQQAARTPDAVAVVYKNESLTYAQLNARANQLAHYLRKQGVVPEVLVGLCVERSLDMIVGMLGILKAGGAYVPLDPSYPSERLAAMLEDSRAPVLLTQSRLLERLPEQAAQTLCLDQPALFAEESGVNPPPAAQPDNLAYVIFTSGSTGRPKGVQICHRQVTQLIAELHPRVGVNAQDIWTVFHSYAFDFSVWEIWSALLSGGRLVVVPLDATKSPESLYALLARERVTVLNLTPSALSALLQYRRAGGEALPELALRSLHCGGEALPQEVAREALDWGVPLWNFYGPTESTVWATLQQVSAADLHLPVVSIGRAFGGRKVYVLDAHQQPVPLGIAGELCIGGEGLARGYLNRPELTAERFLPDPFSSQPGARLYRTGDLARYRPDGSLEFLGRLDHQVKLRGFRIELGEIESVLSRHESVRECVVVAREIGPGDTRLVAYGVGEAQNWEERELREWVGAKLPEYMVPSHFVWLSALPLTPNGKIDRRALPAPIRSGDKAEEDSAPPRDILEIRLAKLWAEMLGLPKVSIRANFFELGGHSLLAVRLFTQIEKTFGRRLPISTLFHAPTVEQLAAILREQEGVTRWPALVPIQPAGSRPPLFCLHRDDGIVMCYRELALLLDPDQPVYGLQAEALQNDSLPATRVEEMAARYVQEIQNFYPDGPYLLAGSSFGGVLAYEAAQQLRAQGRQVALLALIDTYAPVAFQQNLLQPPLPVPKRLSIHLQILKHLPSNQRWNYISQHFKKRVDKARFGEFAAFDSDTASYLPETLLKIQSASREACLAYKPATYSGRTVLFRAMKRSPFYADDPELWWGGLIAGGLEIREVPGSHLSMLKKPHVQVLACELGSILNELSAVSVHKDDALPLAVATP